MTMTSVPKWLKFVPKFGTIAYFVGKRPFENLTRNLQMAENNYLSWIYDEIL